jgi:hypothetical protein
MRGKMMLFAALIAYLPFGCGGCSSNLKCTDKDIKCFKEKIEVLDSVQKDSVLSTYCNDLKCIQNRIDKLDSARKCTLLSKYCNKKKCSDCDSLIAMGLKSSLDSMIKITEKLKKIYQADSNQNLVFDNFKPIEGFGFKALRLINYPNSKTHLMLDFKLGLEKKSYSFILAAHFYFMPPLTLVESNGNSVRNEAWFIGLSAEQDLMDLAGGGLSKFFLHFPFILNVSFGSITDRKIGNTLTTIIEPEIDASIRINKSLCLYAGVGRFLIYRKDMFIIDELEPFIIPNSIVFNLRIETGKY